MTAKMTVDGGPGSTATHAPAKASQRASLWWPLVGTVLILFAVETLIMLWLPDMPLRSHLVHALLDSVLLSVAVLPTVYFLWVRPQMRHAQEKTTWGMGKQREQEMRQLLDSLPIGMYIVQDRKFAYANQQFQEMTGYSRDELLGMEQSLALVAPEDREMVRENTLKMLKAERSSPYEYTAMAKGGGRICIMETVTSIQYQGKRASLGTFMDITARKLAEEQLRESERRYRTTLDSMFDGCQIIGFDWRYLYVNDSAAKHGRRTKEELLGHTMMEIYAGIENTEMFAYLRLCMEKRIPHRMENLFTFPDGSQRWFELSMEPVPEGIFIISWDITEHKQAERDIEERSQRLAALYKVGQALSQSLEPETVASSALEATLPLLQLDAGNIMYLDEASQELVLLAHRGLSPELDKELHRVMGRIPFDEEGFANLAAQAGQVLMVEDFSHHTRYPFLAEAGFQSALFASLKVQDRVMGVMAGFCRRQLSLSQADKEFMESLASMVGMAIANARLFEEQKRRNQELTSLYRVSQAVTASLDLEKVASRALAEALAILDMDAGAIRYVDEATQETVLLTSQGFPQSLVEEDRRTLGRVKLNDGLISRAIRSGQPLPIEDFPQHTRHPSFRQSGFQSACFVPLIMESKVVGIFIGFFLQRRSFSQAEIQMMSSIGNMMGMAIANARLFEIVEVRSEKRAAMNSVTAAIASSLNMEEIYAIIAREMRHIISYDRLTVGLLTSEGDALSILQLKEAWQVPQRQRLEDTGLGEVIKSGEPRIYRDLALEASDYPTAKRLVEMGLHSSLVVPLSAKGTLLGTLNISSQEVGHYSLADLEHIQPIANELAVALSHAQLFEQVEAKGREWQTTFDSISDWVSVHDKDFKIVRANKAFAEALKMRPEEIIGRHCYEVIHGEKEASQYCAHKEALEAKTSSRREFFNPHLGIYMDVLCSPVFNTRGEVTTTVHIARDITERKKMEEHLITTDRLASIGELASGIAHELNNPLTSIIGFSDLLMEKTIPDDIKEDLKVINKEARRTAGVVKNLLTFARKHPQERSPVDINKAIQIVLELRAYEQRIGNIVVNTHFTPDLPETTADGFQLQQVFINIIINAEYFMSQAHGKGALTITTERVGDIIRASFADDGPGIAEENLGHVFDPFFTTKDVGKGTGLGLSICHGIITQHGGRIHAKSELAKGATFTVELPISQ